MINIWNYNSCQKQKLLKIASAVFISISMTSACSNISGKENINGDKLPENATFININLIKKNKNSYYSMIQSSNHTYDERNIFKYKTKPSFKNEKIVPNYNKKSIIIHEKEKYIKPKNDIQPLSKIDSEANTSNNLDENANGKINEYRRDSSIKRVPCLLKHEIIMETIINCRKMSGSAIE